ncbi:Vitamin B12 ABC transporter, B12-binding component BtuF [Mycoavidus cysteinexigens]|uniref:Vitamin B12 ABC transporter, B12-binding component BtuF n=1 Tax=Mycoavidus cysteinexigens TaxID=1553431 RepID=A0A2Z6EV29_9BURK|nr:cobalamin-binding protein [Mycoavidus cysteinexigens]BBE09317.1 Vitamin B12 ABC transporter, B12-binding component BtuF [Mycoavidus cysteinexigens]GAM51926.1 vitamin B12 ABC transporter, B12-binding component BtuF [bacterium endosymbiont of Mortierella elongata FMR23-6]GLR02024.1 cobalamin-binding protein [Mycoavidus cysteinexigens]
MKYVLAYLLFGFLTLASCRVYATIQVKDDSGAVVTLSTPAKRVISLAPHITELIYAAGGGAALRGAVMYSDYPEAAKQLPRVGDYQALDLERIIALKPDLVIAWRYGNVERQLEALRQLNIPIFYSAPHQLDDIALTLENFGALLGARATAAQAATLLRAEIKALRQRYAQSTPIRVFYQISERPLITLNGKQVVSEVIALCGGRNVFAHLAPVAPVISAEAVLAADPQAIIVTLPSGSTTEQPLSSLERWRRWPQLAATQHNALFSIHADLIDRPTPRIAQGAAQLCEALATARNRLELR